ncbi:hypothetical protein MKX01_028575 [Papaver californicum]|nr:hypothetical protein MKX01_028575 [Papaver californicum]
MNSKETHCCQESSSPSSLIRIRRRRYKTRSTRDNSLDAHDYGASTDRTKLKRLRKRDHRKPFTHTARRSKRTFVRHSQRLFNKDYILQEESLCVLDGGFSHGFDGNRENANSSSSDEDLVMETETSEDILSGGPPRPFMEKSHERSDLSNTIFVNNSSPNEDNASTACDDVLSPGHREATCDYREKATQSIPSFMSLHEFNILSDRGMLGSFSNTLCPESENTRVCRPPSISQPDDGLGRPTPASRSPVQPIVEPEYDTLLKTMKKHYNQFLNSVAQLNDAHNQRSLANSVDASARQEILRLESDNIELSSTLRALTEELTRVRQDLTDSNTRESQLKSSFDEIKDVLRKVLGGIDFLPARQTL